MLVLTRAVGESIRIGDDIKITICVDNGGKEVRVGIDAPKNIPIHREEIYERIQLQKKEMAVC